MPQWAHENAIMRATRKEEVEQATIFGTTSIIGHPADFDLLQGRTQWTMRSHPEFAELTGWDVLLETQSAEGRQLLFLHFSVLLT
jgi:hypothetical protein